MRSRSLCQTRRPVARDDTPVVEVAYPRAGFQQSVDALLRAEPAQVTNHRGALRCASSRRVRLSGDGCAVHTPLLRRNGRERRLRRRERLRPSLGP